MKQEIIADLSRITEEEQAILDGKTEVEKERYSSGQKFVMDAGKLLERGKLYNIHLNDGEGSTDDGLMVGTVNFWKTVEVMYYLKKYDFQGVIYFDTFPKREKAVEECEANIKMCRRIEQLIDAYGLCRMEKVVEQNDAVAVSSMMVALL